MFLPSILYVSRYDTTSELDAIIEISNKNLFISLPTTIFFIVGASQDIKSI